LILKLIKHMDVFTQKSSRSFPLWSGIVAIDSLGDDSIIKLSYRVVF
jgi:hypothetical protein